jgi:toxin ParE1/3/4
LAEVSWTTVAVEDLASIGEWIGRDSPEIAVAFTDRIIAATRQLGQFPLSGRVVPEKREDAIREILVGSYRIIYAASMAEVEILAIVHGARLLTSEDFP